jgi:hypothetical protein
LPRAGAAVAKHSAGTTAIADHITRRAIRTGIGNADDNRTPSSMP